MSRFETGLGVFVTVMACTVGAFAVAYAPPVPAAILVIAAAVGVWFAWKRR
jgi:hypothetical protein